MRFTSLRRTIRNFNGLHIIDMHLASMYLIGVHLVAGMLQACMLQVSISQAEISYRHVSLAGVYLRGRRTFIPIEQATRPAGVLCRDLSCKIRVFTLRDKRSLSAAVPIVHRTDILSLSHRDSKGGHKQYIYVKA